MTTQQLRDEMSIAGNPDKIIGVLNRMMEAAHDVDITNAAELINLELAVKRIHAEVRLWIRQYEKRTGQTIR